ncbi:MAG: hypothetical protein KA004_17420 [Verrucomicrobiales bacterium]|nr:hypothetical protein [Verrucomicrobiales bacterium]
MQNVHEYFRALFPGSYRFLKTGGSGRDDRGGKADQISETFLYRGEANSTLTKSIDRINSLLRTGTEHPSRKDFFCAGLGAWEIIPGWQAVHLMGTAHYEGLLDAANRPIAEELGWYYNERFWPQSSPGVPTLGNVPGRPGGVGNVSVLEFQKSVQRSYTTQTLPVAPLYNATADGTMTVPWAAGGAPDLSMDAYAWLAASQSTYNVPNGPYLANRSVSYLRLSTGALVPIYQVTEQWLARPRLTPSN